MTTTPEGGRRAFLCVGGAGIYQDTVGALVIRHAEVYRPADIPELHIVVAVDDIRFQIHLFPVHIEGLGAWGCSEGSHPRRCWPCQGRTGQGTCQYCWNKLFPFYTVDLLLSSAVLVFLTATTYRKSGEKSIAKGVPGGEK